MLPKGGVLRRYDSKIEIPNHTQTMHLLRDKIDHMKEDEFTKLFKYMQSEFAKINSVLESTATKDGLNRLTNSVDAHAKKVD